MNRESSQLNNLFARNVSALYPSLEKVQALMQKQKVHIYMGIDPTSSDVHLGHAVVYWKLREFQDMGHHVTLLIGDFTARIGDPTDKKAVRKKLTSAEIDKNAKDYQAQVSKILDFTHSKNPARLIFNSQWLTKMTFEDVIELASHFTVSQMIERDMFVKRNKEKKPIYLHEFLYPLMQGYDSVAMQVEGEIGGTDQTFNMLAGRTLMKAYLNKEKFVMTVPLLVGLDGQKMSKSADNYIGLNENPVSMYAKIMSLKDELIIDYFTLCTLKSLENIEAIKKRLRQGENPMVIKKELALEITRLYHGDKAAISAETEFRKVHQERALPEHQTGTITLVKSNSTVISFLNQTGLVKSNSEIKRLVGQHGIKIDGKIVTDPYETILASGQSTIIQIGKKKVYKIVWTN